MTFEPSPTAREMAEALRGGVSSRLRDFEAATPDEDLARLRALGAVDEVPAVAKPTGWAAVVRALRRVLSGLLRPWLTAQTTFNRAVAEKSVESTLVAFALSRRVAELERSVHLLNERLRSFEGGGTRPDTDAMRLDRDTLLRLIVQSRMPPPPGRVLVCGSGVIARDLAAFGYEVIESEVRHERSTEGFDAVVWLSEDAHGDERSRSRWSAELPRLLRTGGRGIVVHAPGDAPGEGSVDGLSLNSWLIAQEDESGWTVVEESMAVAAARRDPAPGQLTVVVLHRPHAADH
jgi:hypothetical protein